MLRPLTRPQLKKLQAMFRESGVDDRGAFIHNAIGRRVASLNELNSIEAGVVIEMLAKKKAS